MITTRRELVRGAIAGAAVLGCPSRSTPPPVEVTFVGPDPARGHLLREATLRGATPRERITTKVAIVGAGAAGIAAAWRLARAGMHEWIVLELEDDAGGTARSGELPRSAYPMGAHYLPVRDAQPYERSVSAGTAYSLRRQHEIESLDEAEQFARGQRSKHDECGMERCSFHGPIPLTEITGSIHKKNAGILDAGA